MVTPDQFSSGRTSGQSIPVNFFPNVPAGQKWPAPPVGTQQNWPAPPTLTGQPQNVPISPQMGPQANFMPFYYPPGWAEWAQQMQQQMAQVILFKLFVLENIAENRKSSTSFF